MLDMYAMHDMHIAGIDLNLLVALDALLTHRTLTEAAARVGLSQSAMSHALGRLRQLIGDPLFVRTAKGLAPTPRAQQLAAPIREALALIEQAVRRPAPFAPQTARRSFSLATSD